MFYGPSNFYDDGHEIKRRGRIHHDPQPRAKLLIHGEQLSGDERRDATAKAILSLRDLTNDDVSGSLATILKMAADHYGFTVHEVIANRRSTRRVIQCRMVYYWLARELTLASLPTIGKACGPRHHTTVLSGLRNVKRFWTEYEPIIKVLKGELKP